MIKKFINKLKLRKLQLQKYKTNNDIINSEPIEEKIESNIKISKQDNIFKIEISDYISISDFIDKKMSSDEYRKLDLLCTCILWNGRKQRINKGTYYILNSTSCLYNILFTDEVIDIVERKNIELDDQTQKENVIQDRVITFKVRENEFDYYSAKHDEIGNTYYTRYYSKNKAIGLNIFDLDEKEVYDEVKSIISNLETIKGIENILDVEVLKEYVLKDLNKNLLKRKKNL